MRISNFRTVANFDGFWEGGHRLRQKQMKKPPSGGFFICCARGDEWATCVAHAGDAKTMCIFALGRPAGGRLISPSPFHFGKWHSIFPGMRPTRRHRQETLSPPSAGLSIYSRKELDAIALSLNMRPRARLGFESPLVVYTQHITLPQASTNTVHY